MTFDPGNGPSHLPTASDVAIFASSFYPHIGGVEELVRQLAREQREVGARPLVVTMRWPKSLPDTEVLEDVPVRRFVFRVPERRPRQLVGAFLTQRSILRGVTAAVRGHGADVVHVQCVSGNAWYAREAARALGLPLVVTLQGELSMDATGVYQRSRVLPRLLKELLHTADAVTACSSATLSEAQEFGGIDLGDRAHVVYNGVSLRDFDGTLPAVSPYALAIGRHVPQKGFDVLLQAFARAAESPAFGVDLVLAGDGPDRMYLERMAKDLGIAHRVRFAGPVARPQVPDLFLGCAFFVLPSRHEPMGIVNVEAMAARKAVVATAVGGVPEVVADEVTGLLVPPGDVDAMARALSRVAMDEHLARRLGDAGRRRAADFDWPVVARAYDAVYCDALERAAQRVGARSRP